MVRVGEHDDKRVLKAACGLELRRRIVDLRPDRLQQVVHGTGDHGLRRRRELLDLTEAGVSSDRDRVIDASACAKVRLVLRDRNTTLRQVALKQEVTVAALAHQMERSRGRGQVVSCRKPCAIGGRPGAAVQITRLRRPRCGQRVGRCNRFVSIR